jgi:hypothetical protein
VPALLTFDTNVIFDIWSGRDGDHAVLLLQLAEAGRVELVLPEFVLLEFRGTALRWLREQRARIEPMRQLVREWERCEPLGEAADDVRGGVRKLLAELNTLSNHIDPVIARVRAIARVEPHTFDLHFRGDLRYLAGHAPDRPVDGLKDCRIYEALLGILRADVGNARPHKVFATKDGDFTKFPELVAEVQALGAQLRGDLGRLYGELR